MFFGTTSITNLPALSALYFSWRINSPHNIPADIDGQLFVYMGVYRLSDGRYSFEREERTFEIEGVAI